jgi:phospholipid/cholesterol/gamma-HCH transport system substrate-binding protein
MTSKRRLRLRMLGVVLCAVSGVAVFLYFLTLSGVTLIGQPSFTFRALVPSAVSLSTNADVREAGVHIGSLRAAAIAGENTLLTLSIDRRYGPVYRDAQVLVRAKSLGGENYLNLDPGSPTSGKLPAGAVLPLRNDPEATQLDQILSTFNAPRRRDVQRILDALGSGLGGRGATLNQFLGGTGDLIDNTTPVASVLASNRSQVASLIDDFGAVARALGSRAQDIQTLTADARIEASAIAARNQQVQATLAALPSFLRQAKLTVGHLGTFSGEATPVIHDLRLGTEALVPAVTKLGPAAVDTKATIDALSRFTRVTTPAATSLAAFAAASTVLAPALEAALRQSNPMLAYLAPYATELGAVFSNLRAATEANDSTGHYARLNYNFKPASVAGALTPAENQALQALIKGGVLGAAGALQSNPYPKPGTLSHPVPFTGAYQRIQPDPPYPHR